MKKLLERLQKSANTLSASLATLVKVVVMSRKPSPALPLEKDKEIIIMGNGPSLRRNIENDMERLGSTPLLSVNFAPNTPEFALLRPAIHVIADGVFFNPENNDNVRLLWQNLSKVDWPLTLCLPADRRKVPMLRCLPHNITLKFFNLTPAGGSRRLKAFMISRGLAMPRPRNVLIPSIFCAIREGYSRIFLIGADHSWSKTLWVDDENHVVTVQPHFYKDSDKELKRVENVGQTMRLHQMYESLAIAFRSYFDVRDYADSRGVEIYNATPGSFIDAFPRRSL